MLIQRLTRDEILYYLDNRAAKGFNFICAVFLAEFDGLRTPNAEGNLPLIGLNPTQLNPNYLDLVRFLVDESAKREMIVGLLPTWGDKLTAPWGVGPRIFDLGSESICLKFGTLLANSLSSSNNILWVLGGDRPPNLSQVPSDWPHPWEAGFGRDTDWEPLWKSMAEGIRDSMPDALFAYHPQGGPLSTSQTLAQSDWLDINMMQSGHGGGHDVPVWEWIERDRNVSPAKPTLDAEPNYEDHPVNPWPTWDPALGFFDDYDVRKQCYRSVLSGACGVIYGHHSVWQFWDSRHAPMLAPKWSWKSALDRPGAFQMGYLKEVMKIFSGQVRVPDSSIFLDGPGQGPTRKSCLRTADSSIVVIYSPTNDRFRVRVPVHGELWTSVTWISPRTFERSTEPASLRPGEVADVSPPGNYGPDSILVLASCTDREVDPTSPIPMQIKTAR